MSLSWTSSVLPCVYENVCIRMSCCMHSLKPGCMGTPLAISSFAFALHLCMAVGCMTQDSNGVGQICGSDCVALAEPS